jgi:NAD(P)H-dependent FMN reductase
MNFCKQPNNFMDNTHMTTKPKILAFAGSTRTESYNKKLLKTSVSGARAAGAEVTYLDLRDIPMPLFDEDLEARDGFHPNVRKLKDVMLASQGLLIASPEYNGSISGVLKNAIDWVSRPDTGEAPGACFVDKVAAIMSASPSPIGGQRGLVHTQTILENLKVTVLSDQVSIPKAYDAFNAEGTLKNADQQAAVENLGSTLTTALLKLKE